MAFNGDDVKIGRRASYTPQSADPPNPSTGDVFESDGTPRPAGQWRYDGSNWVEVGSASSSGINYALNPQIEGGVEDFAEYDDGAVAEPTSGDGNSGVAGDLAITRTTTDTEVIRGEGSLKLAKDAADAQGEGMSTDFTIDNADKGETIEITFDKTTTANYESGFIKMFVYDVTNTTMHDVSNLNDGDVSPTSSLFRGSFIAASDSASYRLIWHIVGTEATAWDMFVDNLRVGPLVTAPGVYASEWTDFTPSWNNDAGISFTVIKARWRRLAQNLEVDVLAYATGNGTSGNIVTMDTPNSIEVDSLNVGATGVHIPGGRFYDTNATNNYRAMSVFFPTSTTVGFIVNGVSEAQQTLQGTDFDTNDQININFSINIPGWDVGAQLSPSEVEVVRVAGEDNDGQPMTANTEDLNWTETDDDFGAWDGQVFTAPRDGWYSIAGSIAISPAVQPVVSAYINGTVDKTIGYEGAVNTTVIQVNGDIYLLKDQELSVRVSVAVTLTTGSTHHWITITEQPDFKTFSVLGQKHVATIKQEETSGTDGGTFTTGAWRTRTLNTLDDTGVGVTLSSNQFTLPAGKYYIEASAPAYLVASHKAKLYNITDSADEIIGGAMFAFAASNVNNHSLVGGIVTITSDTTFEIQHQCTTTGTTNGFGVANTYSVVEVYTQVTIEKLG